MRLALVAAVLGSLAIHLIALFGTEIDLSGPPVAPLQAELRPLPTPPPARPKPPPVKRKPAVAKPVPTAVPPAAVPESPPATVIAEPVLASPEGVPSPADNVVTDAAPVAENTPSTAANATPVTPILSREGAIRYRVIKTSLGLTVGRLEQRWSFPGDGSYRLTAISETTGLAALLRSHRVEQESRGELSAQGLRPLSYRVRRNGRPAPEDADFDWSTAKVQLATGGEQPLRARTQDLLSLHFQLAYLKAPENGSSLPVVTGKRYRTFALDALGEEEIDVPAGHFKALHLRVQGDDITEFWIAEAWDRLPVKIRYTDRKGEQFDMLATERGALPAPAPEESSERP